jgi:hypothetical protein
MNLALSLLLIINSAIPPPSQQRPEPTDTRIPVQTWRESVPPPVNQAHRSIDTWSRLRTLKSGTAITVTVQGGHPSKRYFVLADESNLIVLNANYPGLPHAAARILRDMGTSHPEYFATVEAQVFVERDLRMGPSGVFLADLKVADLEQVVERISRTDIETGASIAVTTEAGLPIGAKIAIGVGVGVGLCYFIPICRYIVSCSSHYCN